MSSEMNEKPRDKGMGIAFALHETLKRYARDQGVDIVTAYKQFQAGDFAVTITDPDGSVVHFPMRDEQPTTAADVPLKN